MIIIIIIIIITIITVATREKSTLISMSPPVNVSVTLNFEPVTLKL